MTEQRQSPERFLRQIHEEEKQKQHGKLKIYFGAAPGVGKTYTMLQDAIAKRKESLDVVIGVVESHGREEIERLLKDLEILPKQTVDYRNKKLTEFDLDAALKRKPALILIDEMAHTNVPGLRHTKRWQDIRELLDRGIDVYTTLNVQHIESLNDIIAQIIGLRVKETIPDSVLELADTIEIIDLPPEDLLKRLQQGKIYFPAQANLAAENFFQIGNLIALRDLALRVTAERIEAQVLLHRQGKSTKHIWPTKDRILVCVGPHTSSKKIIRTARRMASNLQAEWIAVYVEASSSKLTDLQRKTAIQNLRFAEQLGAESHIIYGLDLVKEIIAFAHERNITKIIIGKQIRPRWQSIFFKSLTDELIRHSGEIDVYIVTGEKNIATAQKTISVKQRIPWQKYVISIGIVAIATIINFLLAPYIGNSNLLMIYLFGVILVALQGEIGLSILTSVLSVLAYDFFFIPPFYSLTVADSSYLVTLLSMLIISFVISYLTIHTRRQAAIAHLAERRASALHLLSRQLASTRGLDKLLEVVVCYIGEMFDCDVLALLPENNHLSIRARYRSEGILTEKEQSVAEWVYNLGQPAGKGTDTLPSADAIYVPLLATKGPVGVLKVRPHNDEQLLIPEQMHFLEACANQLAQALEVDSLQDEKSVRPQ